MQVQMNRREQFMTWFLDILWLKPLIVFTLLSAAPAGTAQAGNPSNNAANNTVAQAPILPLPTQIKKAVVFLQVNCLHDFQPDVEKLTIEALGNLPAVQVQDFRNRLL